MPAKKENIHRGHRLRTKNEFLSDLGGTMPDHRLLEVLLYYSIPQKDTNEIAHDLLTHFHSIQGVFDADVSELCQIKGVKENTAALIKLILELYRRYLMRDDDPLSNARKMSLYLMPRFLGKTSEEMYMLCLTDKLAVDRCVHLSSGTSNSVIINYKKIITNAAASKCNLVVLAHNHPGELIMPSNEDIQGTVKVAKALGDIGITLADHLIMSGADFLSMKDGGFFGGFAGM